MKKKGEKNRKRRIIMETDIHNLICSACGEEIPEHEKDVNLLLHMSQTELDDLECISCEMKYRDSADLDMFGA